MADTVRPPAVVDTLNLVVLIVFPLPRHRSARYNWTPRGLELAAVHAAANMLLFSIYCYWGRIWRIAARAGRNSPLP